MEPTKEVGILFGLAVGQRGSMTPRMLTRLPAPPAPAVDERAILTGTGQDRMPYVEALRRFASTHPVQAMVPGHSGAPEGGGDHLAEILGNAVVELDLPLMLDGIDLGAESPLQESLGLAAEAWGARRVWWLTNGASQGNRTAALAVRGLGERVLVQRSAHSSFLDGVLLAGMIPSFVTPTIDHTHGVAHGLTPAALEAALSAEAAAGHAVQSVYVVSPSYVGSVADVAGLARVAHAHGAALIVDGAWGAHFGFHPRLPEAPTRLGADLVISSTHKLAGSLTQSAMLHLGEGPFADRLDPLVERAYAMTASTSMSSVLMASLDAARHTLIHGQDRVGEAIHRADQLRAELRADGRFAVLDDGFIEFPDIVRVDPLRIAIDVSRLGQSGHWVRDRLAAAHGVYVEMSTARAIVAVFGALATPDVDRLVAALFAVAAEAEQLRAVGGDGVQQEFPRLPDPGPLRLPPREAYFGESEVVSAAAAIGRISADTLAAYPPGIPNLMPGEEITRETVAFLRAVAASPTGHVRRAVDPAVATIRIVRA